MKRFALIGTPVSHSKSPALFQAAYGGKYSYNLIESDNFDSAYAEFLNGYDGINVTSPFKEKAYLAADLESKECRLTGAANTLVKTPQGIKAYNTDIDGVLYTLGKAVGCRHYPDGANVLIVGCGGAGKSAAYAVSRLSVIRTGRITVMNRDLSKAEKLATLLCSTGMDATSAGTDRFREHFKEADCIIYTIPARLPDIDRLDTHDFSPRHAGKIIIEANYRQPSFTAETLSELRKQDNGLVYCGGEKWLLHQAVRAYRIFTQEAPDIMEMNKVL